MILFQNIMLDLKKIGISFCHNNLIHNFIAYTVKNEKTGRTMMAFMKEHLSFINDFILCENDMTSSAIFINYSSI